MHINNNTLSPTMRDHVMEDTVYSSPYFSVVLILFVHFTIIVIVIYIYLAVINVITHHSLHCSSVVM